VGVGGDLTEAELDEQCKSSRAHLASFSKNNPSKASSRGIRRGDVAERGALQWVREAAHGNGAFPPVVFPNGAPWMGNAVPRWPVNNLSESKSLRLEKIMQEGFNSWNFDIFELTKLTDNRPMQFAGFRALSYSGCFSEFAIDPEKTILFLQVVERGYATEALTAYHNNIHAADVAQTVNALLREIGLGVYFDPMDSLVIVLAACIHDLGHDGRNNAFHIAKQDALAITYNDKSVLENYHLSNAFKLLMTEGTTMLDGLSKKQFSTLRAEMIDMVLGTDMNDHFNRVGDFSEFAGKLQERPEAWHDDDKAMYAMRCMALHCADISNQAKPFSIAHQWSVRCIEEFFRQGDDELQHGFPVSPLCNRANANVPQSQISFIKFIVHPTYEALASLLETAESKCLREVDSNLKAWESRQGPKQEAQEASPDHPVVYTI